MSQYLFLQPYWLWLLPLLALTPWLMRRGWLLKRGQKMLAIAVRHPFASDYQTLNTENKAASQYLLYFMCACLILLALAQPVRLGARLPALAKPVDLMLIIDTSISMVLQDYQLDGQQVDRMTMTQALLDRFTQRFSGKRIGIVVLGDKPHVLLQPSEDKQLVRHLIHRLKPNVAGRQAALGDAVSVAAEQLKSNATDTDTVMVLISDAVQPSGKLSPIAGAKRAADAGVVLYTIAIGSSAMQDTGQTSLIYEPADLELLQQMANITGGKGFHAVDVAAMDAALQTIEKEQTRSHTEPAPQLQQALYIWPLGTAIFILFILALLPYRNNSVTTA